MLQTAPAPSSMPSLDFEKLEVLFHSSIKTIDQTAWERCFPDELEGYDYHVGLENAAIEGFALGWYAASINGLLVCAVPVFSTAYDIATTAQGIAAHVLKRAQRWIPGRLTLKLSCLGSPETEHCQLGFHPDLSSKQSEATLGKLIDAWTKHVQSEGVALQGTKDIRESDKRKFNAIFVRLGFGSIASLPSAYLPISFTGIAEYFSLLSPATRKDMRRKLKHGRDIEVEFTNDISSVIDDIMDMYRDTRARSDWAFGDLSAGYFTAVLKQNPDTATFALYRVNSRLVAANLLLQNDHALLDKYYLARTSDTRTFNLYFFSWFTNVERCLTFGLGDYVSGQAGYDTKLRLGSRLAPNWIYFRHKNWLLHRLLQLTSPFLAVAQPIRKDAQ